MNVVKNQGGAVRSGRNSHHAGVIEQVRSYFEARDHMRRGICLMNAGCHDQAVKSFSLALRLNPQSQGLPETLAQAYLGSGNARAAAEVYHTLCERDPDNLSAWVRRALLLWKWGSYDEAVATLRRAIQHAPDCAEIHFQLGNLLASRGDREEAEMRFTVAIDLDGGHVDALVNLALSLASRGDTSRATRLLQRAHQIKPHDARVAMLCGLASQSGSSGSQPVGTQEGHEGAVTTEDGPAIEHLGRILAEDPAFLEVFSGLSADDIDAELFDVLLAAISTALARRPKSASLQFHKGSILERLGRTEEAIATTRRALDVEDDDVRALIQLGRLYQRAGRSDEASEILERVVDSGVHYADVYLLLGSSYQDARRTEEARRAYQQALRINSNYEAARRALETLPV